MFCYLRCWLIDIVSFPKAQLLFLVGSSVLLVPAILTGVFTYESSEKAAINLAATNSTASNYATAQEAATWAEYAAKTTIPNAILLALWTFGKDAITFHYPRVAYSKVKEAAQPTSAATLPQDRPGPDPVVEPSNQPEREEEAEDTDEFLSLLWLRSMICKCTKPQI